MQSARSVRVATWSAGAGMARERVERERRMVVGMVKCMVNIEEFVIVDA